MQRFSALDASFLRVETPSAHMHVGWMSNIALRPGEEALNAEELAARVEARLHLAPRFRQRAVSPPVGEAVWVDDARFRIERHVEILGEQISGAPALRRLCGEFFGEQLDRSQPLWRILIVPRAGEGKAAVLGKVHHAMVDGIAAVELGMLLFDLAPDAARPEALDWRADQGAGPLRLAVDSVADSALEQFRAARRVATLGLAPRRTARMAETMRRAAFSIAEDALRPAPPSYLNVPISPQRELITQRVPFRRLDALKRALDARQGAVKLNDVLLAVTSGALRRFAALRGEPAEPLRAMVPVSVRASEDAAAGGNRITFAFVELPLDEPEPLRRVALIRAETAELKRSGRIAGSEVLLRGMDALPGFVKERAARLAASPRMYNLTISNVPGPRIPLYAAGARVETIYPVIPNADQHALSIGVLSYAGGVHFSAYADPAALPDAGRLASLIRASIQELEAAVGAAAHAPVDRRGLRAEPSRTSSSSLSGRQTRHSEGRTR
jgi:WS/DGAT/MGAT family acyltransferase